MPTDQKERAESGEKSGHATEKGLDIDLGREKDMRDAEEKLAAEKMMGGKTGPTST